MELSIENKRIKIVFSAILIGYAAALDFIPTFKIGLYPFGYINIFVWIACMGYAVARYKLMILTPALVADQVVSLIPDFLILVDREGKITMANRAIAAALGYKEGELIKKPVETVMPQKNAVKLLLSDLGENGIIANVETAYRSKDGKEIPVIFSRTAIRNDAGDVAGFVVTALDITERKETEDRLRDIQLQQEAILNNIPDIAWLKDNEGRFIMVNEPFGKFCGIRPQEIIGKTDFDIWPKESAQRNTIYDKEVMLSGRQKSLEESLTGKEGEKLVVETIRTPIYNDKREIVGTAGIARDITERAKEGKRLVEVLEAERKTREVITSMLEDNNQVREKLENSLEKLKEAQTNLVHAEKMEAVGRMASGIAHEVKNPLGIILQGINYLEGVSPSVGKEIYEVLQMMKDGVKRADGIVRALLDFSRSQEFETKPQDINSIIESSVGLVQYRIKGSGVEVVRELSNGLPKAYVDAGRIGQVFINLLNNAVDAMPKGGKLYVRSYLSKLKISGNGVGGREGDIFRLGEEAIVVEMEDTGAGIDEAIINKIFDPFFTTKDRTEGTGLGLSIARSIIDIHRGLISVKSKKGEGTKFTIIFKIPERR
ncbi:MAG: PAS domain S-box protein [Candidatus Omnitrophota bacterium]